MSGRGDTPRDEDPRRQRRRESDPRTGRDSAATRIQDQARWVDLQIQQAMNRGEFDDLPGTGKPLTDLGSAHDRDWWLKKLIEREQITGVLPPALQLRKDDAELDALLDQQATEKQVRDAVEDFNRRIVEARRQLQGGPPVITPTRDPDAEVDRWRERMRARRSASRAGRGTEDGSRPRSSRRRWWQPRGRSTGMDQ
ncbi:MAG TPA: DUF1992 domain-containing protein [Marmoricola sp.]|nr:DUF1992 domain-containing protein [Marmoricola sp.]